MVELALPTGSNECSTGVVRGEYGGEETPIIGVMRWRPGRSPGGVSEVPPANCPWGHDITARGAITVGWHAGHALRQYICHQCQRDGRRGAWCPAENELGMWRAFLAGGGVLPPKIDQRLRGELNRPSVGRR